MKTRPLSPHLQIYKWQISMTISIMHRIAGLGTTAGLVLLAVWLHQQLFIGGASYDCLMTMLRSIPGQIVLAGITFCFFFYFLAELRYIAWAFGRGFELRTMTITGWLVALGAVAATAAVWCPILCKAAQ